MENDVGRRRLVFAACAFSNVCGFATGSPGCRGKAGEPGGFWPRSEEVVSAGILYRKSSQA